METHRPHADPPGDKVMVHRAGTVVAVGMALNPGVLWWALPLTPTGTRG
jgi:hypothetical protein